MIRERFIAAVQCLSRKQDRAPQSSRPPLFSVLENQKFDRPSDKRSPPIQWPSHDDRLIYPSEGDWEYFWLSVDQETKPADTEQRLFVSLLAVQADLSV